ncbi:MAG: hypothetical protein QOF14_1254 [Hyphomicrobiales bacterium]|jgi:hypothetical protein|nr:hypothetical protein [Hyphomicrobiales bacterium]
MTRYEPTLIVTRLVVERNERAVYDEVFHEGVNVIRGENSSGKSTVLNFIFYGLGGDLSDWSAVARLCTRVITEVRINGNAATLSREISTSGQQPMEIFGGDYAASKAAPRSDWVRYPYRSTSNRESFSQALFRLMGIPEVSSDLSGNITMHQMLRLLYADQLSPVEHIFRLDQFDRANLRDTVGRLLCGAYDSALYDNDQRIRALGKEFDTIDGQLKSLFSILGRIGNSDQGFTFDWIEGQRRVLEEERKALQATIEEAERQVYSSGQEDRFTLAEQNKAYNEVQRLQGALVAARHERDVLAVAIADSDAFITNLKNKIEALRDSSKVATHIGEVRFQSCPACYAPLAEEAPSHACHLCKTPFSSEQTHARIAALIIDTGLQEKQSEQLQARRREASQSVSERIRTIQTEWQQATRRLAALQRLPSTEARESLRSLHRQAGYLERQIEDLEQKGRLVESIRELSERKEELNSEITRLRNTNEALRAQQQERLSIAYTRISEEVRILLRNDLRRQDIFEDPKHVSFSFSDNRISVDDENYFSASSRAILKSSFCLGFLAAALSLSFFRHPRFCMIDTLENMGVEAIRSHNFQLQMLRVSQESKVEHQIIYATAMIEPTLEAEAFTIGAFSTNDDMTIGIRL